MIMDNEKLKAAGIDVDDALARLMGSQALLERLLGKFTADQNMARLEDAAASGDAASGFEAAHALKGVCGNLSMTRLFELTSRQCDLFRSGDAVSAFALVGDVRAAYDAALAAIAD